MSNLGQLFNTGNTASGLDAHKYEKVGESKTYGDGEYATFYDKDTGSQVVEKIDPVVQTVVFEDGGFTEAGSNDTNLTEIGLENIQEDIQKDIKEAYDNSGGTSNGSVLPGWIKDKYPDDPIKVTSSDPSGPNPLAQLYGHLAEATGEWNLDKEILKNKFSNITEHTIKELMRRGPLNYPQDALYSSRKSGFNLSLIHI